MRRVCLVCVCVCVRVCVCPCVCVCVCVRVVWAHTEPGAETLHSWLGWLPAPDTFLPQSHHRDCLESGPTFSKFRTRSGKGSLLFPPHPLTQEGGSPLTASPPSVPRQPPPPPLGSLVQDIPCCWTCTVPRPRLLCLYLGKSHGGWFPGGQGRQQATQRTQIAGKGVA